MNISTICKYILFAAFILAFIGCTQPIEVENEVPVVTGSVTLSTNTDIPLVAYYNRDSVNTIPVTVRVKGKTEDMDIAHTYDVRYGKEFPIFGLYPDYENTIEITENGVTKSFKARTSPLPEGAPVNTAVTDNLDYEADAFNQDLYWVLGRVTGENLYGCISYDKKGNVRYFQTTRNGANFARVKIENDEIFIESADGLYSLSTGIGRSLEHTAHHDLIELSNGNYVILAESTWGSEDRVVEVGNNGTIIKDLTFGSLFRDIVDVESNPDRVTDVENLHKIVFDDKNIYTDNNGVQQVIDWAHANSLVYDEVTDTMYFSLRCQAVIAVDYSDWKLIWWMADNSLKTKQGIGKSAGVPFPEYTFHDVVALTDYQVKGAGEDDGPKNQHALFLHENGNIAMFDNQGDELTSTLGSRYIEYAITELYGNWVASKVIEYRDASLYSRITSDVDFTDKGNLLMLWGTELLAREIDLYGGANEVLYELKVLDPHPAFVYRIDKMPLYPYSDKNKIYSIDSNKRQEN